METVKLSRFEAYGSVDPNELRSPRGGLATSIQPVETLFPSFASYSTRHGVRPVSLIRIGA
jgi:hypothetical protein